MRKSVTASSLLAGVVGIAMLGLSPTTVQAVGDAPKPAPKPEKKKKKDQSGLKDERIYAMGYGLAKAGQYAQALDVLRTAANQADPRVQTMIGFSLRQLGMVDEAMAYYTAALATNPDATTTRQYFGEAFLQKGETAKAREQLAEIGKRCGTSCSDYQLLADAIAKAG